MKDKNLILNNGTKMPIVGLGTWRLCEQEEVTKAITTAIANGYRLIDTANIYKNQIEIGNALKPLLESGKIKREAIFITGKLWCTKHDDPEAAIKADLEKLQISMFDLYLIHWPATFKTENGKKVVDENNNPVLEEFEVEKLWGKMEKLVESKLTKSIGVANFGIKNLKKLLSCCKIKPAVVQVEIHPYLDQSELIEFCRQNSICITSYSSLGSLNDQPNLPLVREDPKIREIGLRINRTPSQVILSYFASQDIAVIPKSRHENRIIENIDLFQMEPDTIKEIDALKENHNVRYVDYPNLFGPRRFD